MKSTNYLSKYLSLNVIIIPTMMFMNCNQPKQEDTTFDLEKAKGEIELKLRAYENALISGDTIAFGNLYSEDTEILTNGKHSTIGRAAVVQIFKDMVKDSVIGSFETTGLWGNTDLLVEQGTGYFGHAADKWKSTGRYLLVWKKVDGEWQIFKDSWFADPKEEEEE